MSVPSWAVRGAKVVCTRRVWLSAVSGETCPAFGQVLTIRETRPSNYVGGGLDLLFEEIINPPMHYADGFTEAGWHHTRFRPLVPTKTEAQDVALFRDALKVTQRQPERA